MFKKIFCITALAFIASTTYSQVVSDSVTLGPGYVNQVYYQLSTGTKTTASNKDWDLQFFSSLFSASIRTNGGEGVELYQAASTDTSNFTTTTLDTSSLTILRNGYSSWEKDAFTSQATGHPNYGWGVYQGTGNLVGVKIYAIKLSSGVFKKIWIKKYVSTGNVIFSIANLDGSAMITKTLNRSTYSAKRHFYYDVENDSVLDVEPAKAQWDFVFRKYSDLAGPSTYYNVTGALTNANIGVAQVDNTPVATAKANFATYALDSSINIIGYDWKSFSFTSGWVIEDSLSYIMKDYNEDVYQVIFTGTTGSSQGKMYFTKEQIAFASIEENSPVVNIGVFPNPTTTYFNLNFELVSSSTPAQIRMMDMNGRIVKIISDNFTNSGFNQLRVDISTLPTGVYFLTLQSGSSLITKRVVKQ